MARHGFFSFLGFSIVLGLFAVPARGQAPAWLDDVEPLITAREREVSSASERGGPAGSSSSASGRCAIPTRRPPSTRRGSAGSRASGGPPALARSSGRPRAGLLVNGEPGPVGPHPVWRRGLEAWTTSPASRSSTARPRLYPGARAERSGPALASGSRTGPPAWPSGELLRRDGGRAATWVRRAGRDGYEGDGEAGAASARSRGNGSPPSAPGFVRRAARAEVPLALRFDVDYPGRPGEGLVRVLIVPPPDDPVQSAGKSRS